LIYRHIAHVRPNTFCCERSWFYILSCILVKQITAWKTTYTLYTTRGRQLVTGEDRGNVCPYPRQTDCELRANSEFVTVGGKTSVTRRDWRR